jgi:hypothetical protein
MGDGRIFLQSLRDTSFNKYLWNEATFGRIHLAGQYLKYFWNGFISYIHLPKLAFTFLLVTFCCAGQVMDVVSVSSFLNFLKEELPILANEPRIKKMTIFGRYDTVPLLLIAGVLLLWIFVQLQA